MKKDLKILKRMLANRAIQMFSKKCKMLMMQIYVLSAIWFVVAAAIVGSQLSYFVK